MCCLHKYVQKPFLINGKSAALSFYYLTQKVRRELKVTQTKLNLCAYISESDISKPRHIVIYVNWAFKSSLYDINKNLAFPDQSWSQFSCFIFPKRETSRNSKVTSEGFIFHNSDFSRVPAVCLSVFLEQSCFFFINVKERVPLCWSVSESVHLPANGPESLFWVKVQQPHWWFCMFSPL